MTTTTPQHYIYPPRASQVIPPNDTQLFAELNWIGQYKVNDTHILIKYLPQTEPANNIPIEIWNRHGERIKGYTAPDWLKQELQELHTTLGLDPTSWSLLDGGLLDKKHPGIKDTIAIWDILVKNGNHLTGTTYKSRHAELKTHTTERIRTIGSCRIGHDYTDNIFLIDSYSAWNWPEMWQKIHETNEPWLKQGAGPIVEGLVLKDENAELERGMREKNNGDWLVRSRVETGRHRF